MASKTRAPARRRRASNQCGDAAHRNRAARRASQPRGRAAPRPRFRAPAARGRRRARSPRAAHARPAGPLTGRRTVGERPRRTRPSRRSPPSWAAAARPSTASRAASAGCATRRRRTICRARSSCAGGGGAGVHAAVLPPPERGRSPSEARRVGVGCNDAREDPHPDPPPCRGRERRGCDRLAARLARPDLPPVADSRRAHVPRRARGARAVETLRAQLKRQPHSPLDADRTARTLSSLQALVERLQRQQLGSLPTTGPDGR